MQRRLLAAAVASCFASQLALANPTGPAVVHGSATFSTVGRTLTVTNTPNAIIHWQGFSIAAGEATRFQQQSAASSVMNRVVGQDPSSILGTLWSNGRVFLLNPNGIVFGKGSVVDVAGLVATTLNLSDQDFLAGRLNFQAGAVANPIVNQGAITAGNGGLVYLIAPEVQNHGVITAPGGEVLLAAGKTVRLVEADVPGLRVEVTAGGEALNVGQILADGGKAGIYAGLIDQRGIVRADTVRAGARGEIQLRASSNITLAPGSLVSASGAPGGEHDGGSVQIVADDTLDMQRGSAVRVDGGVDGGNGGFLELSGRQKIALNGEYTGRALKAGYKHGSLLIDPKNITIAADLSLVTTISAASGGGAMPLVLSPDGSRAYVGAGPTVNVVTVIDTASNTVVATIPVTGAQVIAISPDGSRVFAVDTTAPGVPGTLSVIDTSTNTVIATPATGFGSNHISVRPDGSKAFITNGNDNRLTVLDTATNTTVQVTIQGGPSVSAVTPDGAFVYANNGASNSVSVVNAATNNVVTTIGVGANPQWIVIKPDGSRAYTANLSANTVSVIDTGGNSVVATIAVGGQPRHIALSADGSRAYVTNGTGNSISVIDTGTNLVIATVPVGTTPALSALSADGSRLYVSNRSSDNVSVISTATNAVVSTVPVGNDPIFVVPRPAGDRVYVTNRADPSVSVLSAATATTSGGAIAFSDSPGATLFLPPSNLNGAWSNVDLAANNDVSVETPIASTDLPLGGTLTLRAGRGIAVNANITTNNGDLNLFANNPGAVPAERDPGAGGITMAPGTTLDANTGTIALTVGAGVPGAASGNLVVENVTAANVNLQQNGRTSGSSILRASGSSLITVTNLLMEVDFGGLASGGSVGTAAQPMRIRPFGGNTILFESHTHEASPGIFVDAPNAGTNLVIGGVPFFGGAVKGVQNVTSGDISITVNGGLTTQPGTAGCGPTGGTGGPICTGSSITLAAAGTGIGNGDLNIGNVVTHIGAGAGSLTAQASNDIFLNTGASITTTGGPFDITLNSDRDASGAGAISLAPGTVVSSGGGAITLGGGADPFTTSAMGTAASSGHGVRINDATLSAGAGDISVRGQGRTGGTALEAGVKIEGTAPSIQTSTGAITIFGQGGSSGVAASQGVNLLGIGSASITTAGGDIALTGIGGSGTFNNAGIALDSVSLVQAGGSGTITLDGTAGSSAGNLNRGVVINGPVSSSSGAINITGLGGTGTATNAGVYIAGSSAAVTSVSGNITIDATGNTGSSSDNYGLAVLASGRVETLSAGSIDIVGQGGAGTSSNDGVRVEGAGTISAAGTLTVMGTGGAGSSSDNVGIRIGQSGTLVRTTGSGNLTLDGQGGGGTDNNNGVRIEGAATVSSGGALTVMGTGVGTGSDNSGIKIGSATLQSTGSGTITLTGQGGMGAFDNNDGVRLESGALVTTTGAVTIDGAGGTGGNDTVGIKLGSATVESTGGGAITLTGQGGPGGDNNNGVRLESGALVTTAGPLSVSGTGAGSGNDNSGVKLGGATIQSTGAGNVTLTGLAGAGVSRNDGVRLEPGSLVSGGSGSIVISGTGAGSTDDNDGARVNAPVQTGGAGSITIIGVAGGSGNNSQGVDLSGNLTTASGAISVTGTGSGSGVGNRGILFYTGTTRSTGGGPITFTGTGSGPGPFGSEGLGLSSGVIGDPASASTIILRSDSAAPAESIDIAGVQIRGTGQLFIEPINPATTIGLGSGGGVPGQFNLGIGKLNAIQDGFSQITIGHPSGTGLITLGGHAFTDPLIVRNTGAGSAGIVKISDVFGDFSTGTNSLSLLTAGNVSVEQGTLRGGDVRLTGANLTVQPIPSASTSAMVSASNDLTIDVGTGAVLVRGSDTSASLAAKLQATGIVTINAGSVSVEGGNANGASASIDPAGVTLNVSGDVMLAGGAGLDSYALIQAGTGDVTVNAGGRVTLQAGTGTNANAAIVADTGMVSITAPECVGCTILSSNPTLPAPLTASGVFGGTGTTVQAPPAPPPLPAAPPPVDNSVLVAIEESSDAFEEFDLGLGGAGGLGEEKKDEKKAPSCS